MFNAFLSLLAVAAIVGSGYVTAKKLDKLG